MALICKLKFQAYDLRQNYTIIEDLLNHRRWHNILVDDKWFYMKNTGM